MTTRDGKARHIAFFNYPAHGHVNPTLPVVAELVGRGHRVTYVVASHFADVVAATGAEVISYESTVPKSWNTVAIPKKVTGDDLAEAGVAHLSEALTPLAEAKRRLADDRPDVIVYDSFGYAAGRLLARLWQVPAVQLATTFVISPTVNPYEKLAATIEPAAPDHPAVVKHQQIMRQALDEHGLGDVSNEEFTADTAPLTVVFVPPEFQHGAETFDRDAFAFVGPCIGHRAHQGDWRPPADGRPVVLVALGSFGYENQADFYREALAALADLPWQVVMSLGGLVKPEDLGTLPPNVEATAWVPQLEVLKHASSFVSHAGMGSTMESLTHGVPPVVVPRTGEQDLVAERLVELKLGRAIAPDELSAEGLREAVLALDGDSPERANVARLARSIAERNGPARAADAILGRA